MARPYGQSKSLPLKRQHVDQMFWAKLTALWHRERMREVYISTGVEAHEARHRANREALEVAQKNGWTGQLPQFKTAMAELIVKELPSRGKVSPGHGVRYWEEQTHQDLMRILVLPAPQLEVELLGYLKDEVTRNGRFAGRTGFYKLTHIVGFMPTTEHLDKRQAFLRAINEIGHDRECADREIYRVVLRVLHTYTHKPFETRLGEPMPQNGFKNGIRKVFGFLPFKSS
jgi:hypothetical protein